MTHIIQNVFHTLRDHFKAIKKFHEKKREIDQTLLGGDSTFGKIPNYFRFSSSKASLVSRVVNKEKVLGV